MVVKALSIIALLLVLCGCATRKQTCDPKDKRCNLLLLISTIDIGPKK